MIICKSDSEIQLMREAGRIVAITHEELRKAVQPGVTTLELDRIAEATIRKHGAEPSFKGYSGFPASICASVNEELVHGIPSKRALKDGDIISIDVGAYIHGFHGDAAVTLPVGQISDEAKKLLEVTEKSLYEGISKATINNRLSDISHAVQTYAEQYGYSIVREYVGHGIGKNMHEDPQIPNFGPPNRGPRLKKGMVLAIEPMVNIGTYHVKTLLDNWTVVTVDGKLCAHFEHTVVITDNGPEILTKL
ncbi:type I methionyl aminopeptidase [Desulfuribacillus alkaliarsenatis]|uniref:Methionine aminopeptidase n=1 Tax=Desulfuribacillus alkaliarsenatis TaxID=766136 RepID=A0A1E5G492_9FIRM|nr:type I methionyl aminopeptidase [Desulfuribacillus alkaliarsenatis]OEF97917.1 type I methionyl aminopeptidase [Desulfuribacillus alkaliarsenatis]